MFDHTRATIGAALDHAVHSVQAATIGAAFEHAVHSVHER